MEEMMYLSVRLGCAVYLLYKVWGQKARIREWCDLLYTPGGGMLASARKDADVAGGTGRSGAAGS
mgnify:CR=1 FL=1